MEPISDPKLQEALRAAEEAESDEDWDSGSSIHSDEGE